MNLTVEEIEFFTSIKNKVIEGFTEAASETPLLKSYFIEEVKEFIKERKIPLLKEPFYPLNFRLVDYLCQSKIVLEGDENNEFEFPLDKMKNQDLKLYFNTSVAPNLLIVMENRFPSAIFTKTGYITLAGGAHPSVIVPCFIICCWKILHVLKNLFPGKRFVINPFHIYNKVATTKIIFNKIYMQGLIDHLREFGFTVQYNSNKINFCFIKQFFPFLENSITFCISPTGGMNILGARNNYEIQAAAYVFSGLLKPFCVDRSDHYPSGEDERKKMIKEAEDEIKEKIRKNRKRKLAVKEKKVLKWTQAEGGGGGEGLTSNNKNKKRKGGGGGGGGGKKEVKKIDNLIPPPPPPPPPPSPPLLEEEEGEEEGNSDFLPLLSMDIDDEGYYFYPPTP